MRYLIIRSLKSKEVLGIVSVPTNTFVHNVHGYKNQFVRVDSVSESEYTTYQILDLFPEYTWYHRPSTEAVGLGVTVYDPKLYRLADDELVKW